MCFWLKLPNHTSIHEIILQTTEPAIMIAGFIIAGCIIAYFIIAYFIIANAIIIGTSFIAITLVECNRPPKNRT